MAKKSEARFDIYEMVTGRILEMLDRGIVPWHKPWTDAQGGNATPRNLKSGKAYRGINVFLLGCAGFSSPYFVTFKQALELGGAVRKGEKGMPVVFWKRLQVEDEKTGEKKTIPMLRYFTVFNVEQCDGLTVPTGTERPAGFSPIAAAEEAVKTYQNAPTITHGPGGAYYSPKADRINMPARESFQSPAHYYATLFHELGHSTGHLTRLAREGIVKAEGFGSHLYSKEELVAEMTAAMLCGVTGIDGSGILDNSAAYIGSWLQKLRDDRKLLVQAAAQAQKAADLVLGVRWEGAVNDNDSGADAVTARAA